MIWASKQFLRGCQNSDYDHRGTRPVKKGRVRIFLWLCAIFLAILAIFRARVIWPEYPTLLTMILFLLALTSVAMLVDTIRQGKPLPRPQGSSPLRIVLIAIAAVTTFYTLVGLLVITPSRYYSYYVYVFFGALATRFYSKMGGRVDSPSCDRRPRILDIRNRIRDPMVHHKPT